MSAPPRITCIASVLLSCMLSGFLLESAAGQRIAEDYATGGSGTSSDPWTGWESAIVTDTEIVFRKGYYEASTTATTIPDDTVLTGVDGAIIQWPSSRSNTNEIFSIDAGTENVIIRGLQFEAGVSVPQAGVSSGGGGPFIQIGDIGDSGVTRFITIERNRFGVARYSTSQSGMHIELQSSAEDLTIQHNYFDTAPSNFLFRRGHSSVAPVYRRIKFHNNRVNHSQQHSNFGSVVQPLLNTYTVHGDFTDFTITDNILDGVNSGFNVNMAGYGLVVSGNVARSDNFDAFLLVGGSSWLVEGFSVTGNACYADDPSTDPLLVVEPSCQLKVGGGRNGIIAGNSTRGIAAASHIDVNNADHVIVVGNTVDKGEDTTQCFAFANVNYITVADNQCIDADNYGFWIGGFDTSSNLSFIGNEVVTTGTSALTDNFFFVQSGATVTDVVLRDNRVRGQDLTGSFVSGTITRLNEVGNIEEADEKGWRLGDDLVEDLSGDGLTVGAQGSLDIDDAITRDAEWDTAAEINARTTDRDFATVDGEETITDKDFTSTTNTFPIAGIIGFVGLGNANGTVYLGPNVGVSNATESSVSLPVPRLNLARLACKALVPPASGSWTATVRDDSSDTSLSCTIDSTSGGSCTDNTSSALFAQDSELSLKLTGSNASSASVVRCVVGAGS